MSRLFILPLAGAMLAVGALLAPAARAADEPKDILAKAIKAHGGEASLTKFKAGQIKTKGKLDLPGLGEVEFTQETSYMLPDKYRDSMELKAGGKNIPILTIINGDKVTVEVDGKALDAGDKVKDAMKDVGHVIEVGRLVPLKDKQYELSIIGEDKVEGKKAVGVLVSKKGEKDVSVYFDKETGLVAKYEHRTTDQATGNEVAEERIITEYGKNKNGLPTAKKLLIKRDGKKFIEVEVLEVELFEKLDDSVFRK